MAKFDLTLRNIRVNQVYVGTFEDKDTRRKIAYRQLWCFQAGTEESRPETFTVKVLEEDLGKALQTEGKLCDLNVVGDTGNGSGKTSMTFVSASAPSKAAEKAAA